MVVLGVGLLLMSEVPLSVRALFLYMHSEVVQAYIISMQVASISRALYLFPPLPLSLSIQGYLDHHKVTSPRTLQ